ncbi:MAG: guanylate kinase [Anaerolineaceae bacterium]
MAVEEQISLSFDLLHPQPLLIVISGPSGVGKDAVIGELKQRDLPLHVLVTMTSRAPRANEVNGVDYIFVTREEFLGKIERGEMIEHAVVYQDLKGIPRDQVKRAMESGKDVVLRVDVQGAASLRKLFPEAVLIFLTPTNQEEWFQRLKNRKTETPESLALRLKTAGRELDLVSIFDYVVVNTQDCLCQAVDNIVSIINAEHHRVNHRRLEI